MKCDIKDCGVKIAGVLAWHQTRNIVFKFTRLVCSAEEGRFLSLDVRPDIKSSQLL